MTCRSARTLLSAYRDGELETSRAGALAVHLAGCADCGERWRSLFSALDLLAEAPRLEPSETVASRVQTRLEVERRGPGLALLFRPFWAARPLILPSLIPAALLLVAVLGAALGFHRDEPLPEVYVAAHGVRWGSRLPAWGTEGNPLFPSSGVGVPQAREGGSVPAELLAGMAEGTLFLETVVARDGSVSTVTLLEGDSRQAKPFLEALRQVRFVPVRFRGRPVAVSVYRLISSVEVRAPLT